MVGERYRTCVDLSTELGTDKLTLGLGSWCHLDGNNTSEWTSSGWVSELDHADILLSTDSSGALGVSWNGDCDWVILVDVGSTLHDSHVDQCAGNEGSLLWSGDVTLGTWDLGDDIGLSTGGECTSTCWVDDGGVWTSSICGDDVEGTGEGSTWGDLRKGGAGGGHDCGHVGGGVGTN